MNLYEHNPSDQLREFQFRFQILANFPKSISLLNNTFLHSIYDRFAEEYRYVWGPILSPLYNYGVKTVINDCFVVGFSFIKPRGIYDYLFLKMVANFITFVRRRSVELNLKTSMDTCYIVYRNCDQIHVEPFYNDIDTP